LIISFYLKTPVPVLGTGRGLIHSGYLLPVNGFARKSFQQTPYVMMLFFPPEALECSL